MRCQKDTERIEKYPNWNTWGAGNNGMCGIQIYGNKFRVLATSQAAQFDRILEKILLTENIPEMIDHYFITIRADEFSRFTRLRARILITSINESASFLIKDPFNVYVSHCK